MIAHGGARHLAALLVLSGGALVATGAVAPWVGLYGGLHTYSGITGLWGKVMLAAGLVMLAVALLPAMRVRRHVGSGVLVAAICIGVLAATRLMETRSFVASADSAMLVPQVGPGLFIAIAGCALAVIGSTLLSMKPQRANG